MTLYCIICRSLNDKRSEKLIPALNQHQRLTTSRRSALPMLTIFGSVNAFVVYPAHITTEWRTQRPHYSASLSSVTARRALGAAHVPPTKVFRLLTGSVNKTTLKPRIAATVGRKTILKPRVAAAANTYTSDFLDVKFSVAALKRYRRKHPVPASGL